MKKCDNSTRKIHTSSNFILSISLLIMFDTLLLRQSLHCNTSLHFTQLHFTTLIDTSLPLIYTSLPSHLTLHIYISYRSISSHITKLDSTVLIFKPISKIMNPFTALKNFSTFHFTSLHFLFYLLHVSMLTAPFHWEAIIFLPEDGTVSAETCSRYLINNAKYSIVHVRLVGKLKIWIPLQNVST